MLKEADNEILLKENYIYVNKIVLNNNCFNFYKKMENSVNNFLI